MSGTQGVALGRERHYGSWFQRVSDSAFENRNVSNGAVNGETVSGFSGGVILAAELSVGKMSAGFKYDRTSGAVRAAQGTAIAGSPCFINLFFLF